MEGTKLKTWQERLHGSKRRGEEQGIPDGSRTPHGNGRRESELGYYFKAAEHTRAWSLGLLGHQLDSHLTARGLSLLGVCCGHPPQKLRLLWTEAPPPQKL